MTTKPRKQPRKQVTVSRRPRIITTTVRRLRAHADFLADINQPTAAKNVLVWADELDAGADGRETQEKRKRGKAVAATRKAGKR